LGRDPWINEAVDKYDRSFNAFAASAGIRRTDGLIDQSAKAGLALNNWTAQSSSEKAVEWFQFDWEYGQPPDLSSWVEAANNYNYTFVDWSVDNMFVTDQRGFKTILDNEAATFLSPYQVLVNTTVDKIAYNETGVTISAVNSNGTGYTIEAEFVIVTFSVGVLQHDANALFTPPLPDWKMESIQAFSMATYTKIFLSFPTKFWSDSQFSLYIDPYTRGRYTVWQDLALPDFLPNSNITFVTTVDTLSYIVEDQPDNVTVSQVLEVLRTMYPGAEIPQPNGFLVPRWYSDPFFRGSYSNWPAGYPKELQMQLAAPIGEGRVVFSGEATSYKYYGFLQGAYYEGIRAGQEVLQCIQSSCRGIDRESILKGCNGL
jgi:polyamine oxidase